MWRWLAPVALAVVTLAACDLETSATEPATALTALPDAVTGASEEAELDGYRFRIEGRVWRNLQPNAAGGGIPQCANLCAELRAMPLDDAALDDVVIPEVWAVTDGGGRAFEHLRVREDGGALGVTASRGPWLEPGTEVFVVVRLTQRATGDSVLVRSPRFEVERVN